MVDILNDLMAFDGPFELMASHKKHLMTDSKGNSEFCFPETFPYPHSVHIFLDKPFPGKLSSIYSCFVLALFSVAFVLIRLVWALFCFKVSQTGVLIMGNSFIHRLQKFLANNYKEESFLK